MLNLKKASGNANQMFPMIVNVKSKRLTENLLMSRLGMNELGGQFFQHVHVRKTLLLTAFRNYPILRLVITLECLSIVTRCMRVSFIISKFKASPKLIAEILRLNFKLKYWILGRHLTSALLSFQQYH